MLDTILSMSTKEEFTSLCSSLVCPNTRAKLFSAITSSDVLLDSNDLWLSETLDSVVGSNANHIERFLDLTAKEPKAAKLLHRLQIIGYANPGLSKSISCFLNRAVI